MGAAAYSPAQGDLVWLDFNPQAGQEQAGSRPAVILSPTSYNRRVGLALVCPVTTRAKGYPFEVLLPGNLPVAGVVLVDHIKSQDWRARRVEFIAALDEATVAAVLQRASVLFERDRA